MESNASMLSPPNIINRRSNDSRNTESPTSDAFDVSSLGKKIILMEMVIIGLYLLTIPGYTVFAFAGIFLSLLLGWLFRILIFGIPTEDRLSASGLISSFVESFAISSIILSPLPYILPWLFGPVNFRFFIVIILLILSPLAAIIRPRFLFPLTINGVTSLLRGFRNEPNLTVYICIILWLGVTVADFVFSFHVYFNSFPGELFLTRDNTSHLAIIQSLATGIFPPPNLTKYGTSLLENPIALTLSLGYDSIILSLTNMSSHGGLFLLLLNGYLHGLMVPVVYYVARRMLGKIKTWTFFVSALSMSIVMDVSSLMWLIGAISFPIPSGVTFPWCGPDEVARQVNVSGLGGDSLLLSFQHLHPILLFLFILGFLAKGQPIRWWQKIAIIIAIIELPFYHLGVGIFLFGSLCLYGLGVLITKINPRKSKTITFVTFKLVVIIPILLLLVVDNRLIPFVDVCTAINPADMLWAIASYLGLFSILGLVGYVMIIRMSKFSLAWIFVIAFDFLALFLLFISASRNAGAGQMPIHYYPAFAIQMVAGMLFIMGFNLYKQSSNSSIWSKKESRQMIPRLGTIKKAAKISIVIFVLSTSYLYLSWGFSSNYGEYHMGFYESVPRINTDMREMLTWLAEHSDIEDTILCSLDDWEISAIIGRQILYTGYRPPNIDDPRYQAYLAMYGSSSFENVSSLFQQYDIEYVIISPSILSEFPDGIIKFSTSLLSTMVYDGGQYVIYRITH